MSFDPNAVWQQLGTAARIELGVRDWAYSVNEAYVFFRVGAPRPHRRVRVHLNARDLYDIEIGRFHRFEWITDDTTTDVDCEQLAGTVVRMHTEVCAR